MSTEKGVGHTNFTNIEKNIFQWPKFKKQKNL